MNNRLLLVLIICFRLCLCDQDEEDDISNGWGSEIDWKRPEDAFKIAKELEKPIMFLVHRPSCGACKSLKPVFAESQDIEAKATRFVMSNAVASSQDIKDLEVKLSPDGGYVPRILFFNSQGTLMDEVTADNDKYKHFYHSAEMILEAMDLALEIQDEIDEIPNIHETSKNDEL